MRLGGQIVIGYALIFLLFCLASVSLALQLNLCSGVSYDKLIGLGGLIGVVAYFVSYLMSIWDKRVAKHDKMAKTQTKDDVF
jgi:hypothetical protein